MEKLFNLLKDLENFKPFNEQEEKDKSEMLRYISKEENVLTRDNKNAHITVSAWLLDETHKYVLMAHHNIYNSWAWLGGHADGNENLKEVILKEIKEESGIINGKFLKDDIFSLEILPVAGHEKKGEYVSSHLHLNVTYLLEADKADKIRIKDDENSKIGWIDLNRIDEFSTENWFIERVYNKLCSKLKEYVF